MKSPTRYRLPFISLLLAIWFIPLWADMNHSIRFRHLTNNDGLPGNTVFSTCQDYKGFIWIGSKNGLCKYDGKTILQYDIKNEKGESLSNALVRQVFEDSKHRLWVIAQKEVNLYDRSKDVFNCITTDSLLIYRRVMCEDKNGTIYLAGSGVLVYNEKQGQFEPFRQSNGQEVIANIPALTIDTSECLWIGKEHTGIICIDLKSREKTEINHNVNDTSSLLSDKIVSLYTDKTGRVWIGTLDKGVCYFDRTNGRFISLEGFPDICVRTFAEDLNGDIWIGSEDGLYIYSPESGKLVCHKQNYNDRYSLNDNAIYSIYRDKENNMLISTYFGGINIYPNSFRQFFHYDYGYTDKYLSGKAVRQIVGDKEGNLWIATEDGGLNYYDQAKERFEHIKPIPGVNSLSYHNVHSILLDSGGKLWIGTFLGGLNKYDPATRRFTHYSSAQYPGLAFDNIFVLLEDRDKRIWIGTTNGLSIYDPALDDFLLIEPEKIASQGIEHLLEDSKGNIWIATRTQGVYCHNRLTKQLSNISCDPTGSGLPDNCVNYIYEDSDRNIWFGTNEGGLCKYSCHTGSFTTFTEKDGLPSNTIFSLIESNSGNLWISTNNGLSCLAINDYTFTNYSVSEGLPNKQFNYNSAYRSEDGRLFFGTINGMIAFYPEELQTIGNVAQVEFSSLRILGKIIKPDGEHSPLPESISEMKQIQLDSEQAKSFTLEFTVPTLSHPNSTFFAIRFNKEKDWVYIGSQSHITYANLPPGDYMLHVKAAFNNKWTGSEPVKSMRITVLPPFWLSTTAFAIYGMLFIVSLILTHLFIKRRQEEKRLILAERLEKEKIKEINALKLNFFTNISHELRTPLTLILTPIQSYLDKHLFSPDIHPKMEQVAGNVRRMNNLVDELVLFSKIESRQENIRVKKGDLLQFTETICNEFQCLAEEKGLVYEVSIEPSKQEVWFAPVKVEKIVYNLLSNAFKYTNTGRITVCASYKPNNGYIYLHFSVADTGVGIATRQIEHIFESYYQVNDFVNGKKTGFGIGLALVRELVNLHKGSIQVESELGKGTLFSVRLNVSAIAFLPDEVSSNDADSQFFRNYKFLKVKVNEFSKASVELPTLLSADKPSKLLLVEDNPELLAAYAELFRDSFTILTAENGQEGIDVAERELPDIIISDVMMPVVDGFEMTELLRSHIETCHIPVVLLTARTGEEAQMEGYDCGANLYIEKPFHPILFYKQIANLMHTKENERKRYAAGDIALVDIDAAKKDKKLITRVEEIIIDHLSEYSFSLNDLLKEVGVGRTLLHVKLKSILGLSTTEFINKVRLNESVKLLAKGKNISEAAYATGFSSPNYYSRCFRKLYGMSPNEYIKQGSKQAAPR